MGYSWQFALTAVFIEGLLFILLTVTGLRTMMVEAMPLKLRQAIVPGIGLFITFIGMQNAGIVVCNEFPLHCGHALYLQHCRWHPAGHHLVGGSSSVYGPCKAAQPGYHHTGLAVCDEIPVLVGGNGSALFRNIADTSFTL